MSPLVARALFANVAAKHGVTEEELWDVIDCLEAASRESSRKDRELLIWALGVCQGSEWALKQCA